MEKVRRDTNFIVLGLVLYTLLRYVIFALEPLARVCFVRLVCSDSAERTVLLQHLEENAANSGVSSIVAVLAGVLFLGWCFRRDTPPQVGFQKKLPLPWKRLPLLICIFMGAQLIYSLFGNVLEFLLRLCGYTAMGQLNAASAQSTTVSMFLYTAVFAPVGEELIYRGLVMRQFQKYGNVFAIVVSAALFGVMHANLFQMIFAFLTGLVLGYTAAEFSVSTWWQDRNHPSCDRMVICHRRNPDQSILGILSEMGFIRALYRHGLDLRPGIYTIAEFLKSGGFRMAAGRWYHLHRWRCDLCVEASDL